MTIVLAILLYLCGLIMAKEYYPENIREYNSKELEDRIALYIMVALWPAVEVYGFVVKLLRKKAK